jgi:hypothetical protein
LKNSADFKKGQKENHDRRRTLICFCKLAPQPDNAALQPRRVTIPLSAVGCKRLLGGAKRE